MIAAVAHNSPLKNTSHKLVIPFYVFAALSLLAATVMLFFSVDVFTGHYFQPKILAITHVMALGWGTMIILGAGHQLVPVLVESELFSEALGYISFILAAVGIPLLIYGFYHFRFDTPALTGAIVVNLAILCFLINLAVSISKAKKENVHAVFIFTATVWLFITTVMGLLLVWNFTDPILPQDSLQYLSLHAHLGIAGWFLLLVMGVGSRLIPMFLISKYESKTRLWIIYWLVNSGLLLFVFIFFSGNNELFYLLPLAMVMIALVLFGKYCFNAYKVRVRKKVDEQMKISLGSVMMMLLPLIIIVVLLIVMVLNKTKNSLVIAYGFTIFFGWLTAIILGMTFKTLPFIVWNKLYKARSGTAKTPNPKDLFNEKVFKWMLYSYLPGFVLFIIGIIAAINFLLQLGTLLLLLAAVLYNWNVFKMLKTKPV